MSAKILHEIGLFFEHNQHPVQSIRNVVGSVFLVMIILTWLIARHRSRKRTEAEELQMIEAHYQKNEAGLYPWEVNTDDSPQHLDKDAKPAADLMDYFPQRGRWR